MDQVLGGSKRGWIKKKPHCCDWFSWGSANIFGIHICDKPGAAWSLFSDYPQALTLLAIIALFCIFYFRKHLELYRHSLQFIFGAICGGILGNLGDRLFREPAEVVDFIDVFLPWLEYDYPIFNIADSAIFIGAFSYLILGYTDTRKKKGDLLVTDPKELKNH